jgi:hypothetical protein
MKSPLKSLVLCKSEYLGPDPKFFASQVGSGSESGSETEK